MSGPVYSVGTIKPGVWLWIVWRRLEDAHADIMARDDEPIAQGTVTSRDAGESAALASCPGARRIQAFHATNYPSRVKRRAHQRYMARYVARAIEDNRALLGGVARAAEPRLFRSFYNGFQTWGRPVVDVDELAYAMALVRGDAPESDADLEPFAFADAFVSKALARGTV